MNPLRQSSIDIRHLIETHTLHVCTVRFYYLIYKVSMHMVLVVSVLRRIDNQWNMSFVSKTAFPSYMVMVCHYSVSAPRTINKYCLPL